jgi:hypothetical protein
LAVAPHRSDALDEESAAALALAEREDLRASVAALSGLVVTEGSSLRAGLASALAPEEVEVVLAACRECGAVRYVPKPGSGVHAGACPACTFVGYMILELPPCRYETPVELREALRRVGHALGMTLPEAALAHREAWLA